MSKWGMGQDPDEWDAEKIRSEKLREHWIGLARKDFPEKSDQELLEIRKVAAMNFAHDIDDIYKELYEKYYMFIKLSNM
jgi:hypothetical protein